MKYTPRLKKYYLDTIVPKLTEQFKYTTVMQVPKVLKVCINQGVGEATQDRKSVDIACAEISLITGQKAVPTKSKKAISNFKLREDMAIGARVTLRGDRMYEFLDRLIAVALPGFVTLEESMTKVSTVEVILPWVLQNKLFSLKSI